MWPLADLSARPCARTERRMVGRRSWRPSCAHDRRQHRCCRPKSDVPVWRRGVGDGLEPAYGVGEALGGACVPVALFDARVVLLEEIGIAGATPQPGFAAAEVN